MVGEETAVTCERVGVVVSTVKVLMVSEELTLPAESVTVRVQLE